MFNQNHQSTILASLLIATGFANPEAAAAQTTGGSTTAVVSCDIDDRSCLAAAASRGDLVNLSDGGSAQTTQQPVTYRDVTFADGSAAFADEIVSFEPGAPASSSAYAEPANALGEPDWNGGSKCRSADRCSFVSLGRGGSVVARFTDNILSGSGSPELDLWIFEVGPQVEDMFVEVSEDGLNWVPVGAVGGGKSGVDLDAYGFGPASTLSFVRLTDDPEKDGKRGSTVGADIDAIGAISSGQSEQKRCYCE